MTITEGHRRGRSVISAFHVHLVFVTKNRRGVLRAHHLDLLGEVFAKVCSDFGAVLVECNGEDDHVHLLIEYPPTVPVSRLVNSLKGVSSRRLRQRYSVRTHREHLWSPSYFAASCGARPWRSSASTSRTNAARAERHGLTRPEGPGLRPQGTRSEIRAHERSGSFGFSWPAGTAFRHPSSGLDRRPVTGLV